MGWGRGSCVDNNNKKKPIKFSPRFKFFYYYLLMITSSGLCTCAYIQIPVSTWQATKKKKTRVQTPNAGLLVCSVWFYISTLYISTTPNSELQAFTQKRIVILVSPPPARSSMLSPYFPFQNFLPKGVKSLQMLCTFPPSPTPFTL